MLKRVVPGIVLCLIGIVWIGQGIGTIGGSSMTGHGVWAVIGSVLVVAGVALLLGARRSGGDIP